MNRSISMLYLSLLIVPFFGSVALSSDKEICEEYCKKPRAWPKARGLKYQPKGKLCGGQPTIIATKDYAGVFSLVGRNEDCQDRSNPDVSEPSDYKPKFRGSVNGGQYFCFENEGQYSQTVAFSLKLNSTGTWGNGVECYRVKNIRKAMPFKKR